MDATLRYTASAAAECNGRLLPVWHSREPTWRCPQRNPPCSKAWQLRRCQRQPLIPVSQALSGQRQTGEITAGLCEALPETASLTSTASRPSSSTSATTTTVEPQQHAVTSMAESPAAAAHGSAAIASAAAAAEGDGAGHGATTAAQSMHSSFDELPTLGSFSSFELDGDEPDVCTLVADPASGDVKVVCESDPAHPLSLAEVAVYNPPLPPTLLQDIEARLEADLTTVAVAILFAVGFITMEFGVDALIDHYFGDGLLSDAVCTSVGLVVVIWVRLSKVRLIRFDRWR